MSHQSCRALLLFLLIVMSAPVTAQQEKAAQPPPVKPPAVAPGAETAANLIALEKALAAVGARLEELHRLSLSIEKQTRPQGFSGKVIEAFAVNTLWEFFGFSPSDKSVFGMAFSILGVVGVGVKIFLAARKRRSRWLDAALLVYLALCVLTLGAFSYSNHAATTRAAAVADPDVRVQLRELRTELADFRRALVSGERPSIVPGSPAADLGRVEKALNDMRVSLITASTEARDAAVDAKSAAETRSTGWGWHLLMLLLLGGVIALQVRIVLRETT